MAEAKSTRSRHKPRPGRRSTSGKLPDLEPILYALRGARALITTAHVAMRQNDSYGPEEYVFGEGIAALQRVYNALDRAAGRLSGLRRKQSGRSGAPS